MRWNPGTGVTLASKWPLDSRISDGPIPNISDLMNQSVGSDRNVTHSCLYGYLFKYYTLKVNFLEITFIKLSPYI